MASIWKNPKSRYWTACWRDPSGRQKRASTKTTDRRLARRIAEEFERATKSRRTLAQIEKVLRSFHEELGGESFEKRSLPAFCAEWLTEKEPSVSASTIRFYRKTVQKLLEHFGERAEQPIGEVTSGDLVAFRNQLAKGISASSTNHDLIAVRMIFKAARRLGRITEDPAEFLASVRNSDDPHEEKRRPFTEPELRVLMAAADPEWRSMIRFGLYTGTRLSDIATLRWSNVDLQRGELSFTARKTGKTALLPIVGPLLIHIESLPSSVDPHGFLHPRAGEIFKRTNHAAALSCLFGELLEEAGLRSLKGIKSSARRRANALSFHSLRHNCVSTLKDAGIPMATVLEMVGHLKARDSAFFYKIARGLEALARNEQALSEDPRYHLASAYEMLCARNSGALPTKKGLVEMAQHHWAVKRVLNNSSSAIPALPSNAKIVKLITREKERLPKVRWNRYYKELGLENLPTAKAGRRKSPGALIADK